MERSACPTCGSCSGMFTANSMNCLNEALGPGAAGQRHAAGDARARAGSCSQAAGKRIVELAKQHYVDGDAVGAAAQHRHLRGLRERDGARHRHGRLDQHGAAHPGHRARGGRRLHDGRHRSPVAQGARTSARSRRRRTTTSRTCTAPAASSPSWASSIAAGLIHRDVGTVHAHDAWARRSTQNDIRRPTATRRGQGARAGRARAACRPRSPSRRTSTSPRPTPTPSKGCIRDVAHAYSKDGGLAVLYGNIAERGLHREDRRRRRVDLEVRRAGARLPLARRGLRRHPRRPDQARATSS